MNKNIRIKILGYEHSVEFLERLGGGGRAILGWQSIELDAGLCDEQLNSTLLHEVIEQINSHLHLDLSEQQICGVEVGIYSYLKNGGIDLGIIMKTGENFTK